MNQTATMRTFLSREYDFACLFVAPAGNGEQGVVPAVDVICPLIVVARVCHPAACVSAAQGFVVVTG